MNKKCIVGTILVILAFSACSPKTSADECKVIDDKNMKSSSYEADELLTQEEMDEYISPYLDVLEGIKEDYGIEVRIDTSSKRRELYYYCRSLNVDDFRQEMLLYLGISENAVSNMPYRKSTFNIDTEIIHHYIME